VRPPRIALLVTVLLASCGGEDASRPTPTATLGAYSASTNELCSQLAGAVRRAFEETAQDPAAALSHYAHTVHDAGKRFSGAPPPASLQRFHAAAVRHLALESATLRRAAALSAAGDPAAALRTLHATGLLPDPIPSSVLRRAPACRGAVVPAMPGEPLGQPA
jgi:hypothetical protein